MAERPERGLRHRGRAGVVAERGRGAVGGAILVDHDQATGDGYFVTAYHVVADWSRVEVRLAGGKPLPAQLAGFDLTKDLAVLRVPGARDEQVAWLTAGPLRADGTVTLLHDFGDGAEVQAAQARVGLFNATEAATLPNLDSEYFATVSDLLTVTVPDQVPRAGDAVSAGPEGRESDVIGMVLAPAAVAEPSVYVLPAGAILPVVSAVKAGQDSGTVRVGPAGDLGLELSWVSASRPKVTGVRPGGPADLAGIKAGDWLLSVGETSLGSSIYPEVGPEGVIRLLEPGTEVEVGWLAGGARETSATLTVAAHEDE